MDGPIRYTEEFKLGAVAQVTDKGRSVTSVAGQFGIRTKSLHAWIKRYGSQADDVVASADTAEIRRLFEPIKAGCIWRPSSTFLHTRSWK